MKDKLINNEYYYIMEDDEIVEYLEYRDGFFYRRSTPIFALEEIQEKGYKLIKNNQI